MQRIGKMKIFWVQLLLLLAFQESILTKSTQSQRNNPHDFKAKQPLSCFGGRYSKAPLKPCEGKNERSCHEHGCCWREVYPDSAQLSCFYPPVLKQKRKEQCVIESEDKEWCGFNDEDSCLSNDCCWVEDPGFPYCYNKLTNPECEVISEDKLWCGFNDETSCLSGNCCWVEDPGFPYCYERAVEGTGSPGESTTASTSTTTTGSSSTTIGTTTIFTGPPECAVDTADKIWCETNDQEECFNKGCCWADDPGAPYCYETLDGVTGLTGQSTTTITTTAAVTTGSPGGNSTVSASTTVGSTLPPGEVCSVSNDNKVPCARPTTNQIDCDKYSCCWNFDSSIAALYWCHENNVDRPPFYDLAIDGDFTSLDGSDFSASCVFSYNQVMSENADEMVNKINDKIGVDLCNSSNLDDILTASSSVFLSAASNQGTSSVTFSFRTGVNQQIRDVETCVAEIYLYVREMTNWDQPIFPPITGCPRAIFSGEQFNSTGVNWNCDYGGESRILSFAFTLSGSAETNDNSDLSNECADAYSGDLADKANELVPSINQAIGVALCVQYPNVELTMATATLFASGNQVSTTSTFFMRPELSMQFIDVSACAEEIAIYLEDHTVWGEPVLPPRAGCPLLIFPDEQFFYENQDWVCS